MNNIRGNISQDKRIEHKTVQIYINNRWKCRENWMSNKMRPSAWRSVWSRCVLVDGNLRWQIVMDWLKNRHEFLSISCRRGRSVAGIFCWSFNEFSCRRFQLLLTAVFHFYFLWSDILSSMITFSYRCLIAYTLFEIHTNCYKISTHFKIYKSWQLFFQMRQQYWFSHWIPTIGVNLTTLQLCQKYGPTTTPHFDESCRYVPRCRSQLYQHGILHNDPVCGGRKTQKRRIWR